MKRSVLALAMGLLAITAMAKTIKTTVFTTSPQMHCENCENKIKGNLRFEKDEQSALSPQKCTT